MNGTLYAFGCSHTAGQSLCKDISKDVIKQYYIDLGYDNFDEFSKIKDKRREKLIKNTWFKMIPKVDFPENCYASHLANILNLDYKNYAVSGTGIDTVYHNFFTNLKNINWKTDVVIVELPPIARYKSVDMNVIYSRDYNWKLRQIIPNLDSLKYYYAGIVSLLSKYPVRFVNTLHRREQEISEHYKIKILNEDTTLLEICEKNNLPRYPTGHFWYESHEMFAKLLAEKII